MQVYPDDPPPGTIIFPTAIELLPPTVAGDPSAFLLITNSNYDARFRQGTLQAYDLEQIRAAVDACTDRPCVDEDTLAYLADEVMIGPHTNSIAVSPRGDRVYLAVRSESDMTWVDVGPDGDFDCGAPEAQPGEIEDCTEAHRTTAIADDCRDEPPVLSGDVVAVLAGEVQTLTGAPEDAGLDWSMLVHRNGMASLFIDSGAARVPTLVHVLEGLPTDASNAAYDPYRNVVWMTNQVPPSSVPARPATRELTLIGVAYDRDQPTCSSAFAAGRVPLRGIDSGTDMRDVVFADDGRYAHVLSRSPNSIITIDTEGMSLSGSDALITSLTPVSNGPARLDIARMSDGSELVLATCFDERVVWAYDSESRDLHSPIHGFQGPQDVVIDGARGLAYVADFRDSVIRVIDLRPLLAGGTAEVALQIGTITPVRTL